MVLSFQAKNVVEEASNVTAPLYAWLPLVLIEITPLLSSVLAPVIERLATPTESPNDVPPALFQAFQARRKGERLPLVGAGTTPGGRSISQNQA